MKHHYCPRCDKYRPPLSKIIQSLTNAKAEAEAAASTAESLPYYKVGYYEATIAHAIDHLRCHARTCARKTTP